MSDFRRTTEEMGSTLDTFKPRPVRSLMVEHTAAFPCDLCRGDTPTALDGSGLIVHEQVNRAKSDIEEIFGND